MKIKAGNAPYYPLVYSWILLSLFLIIVAIFKLKTYTIGNITFPFFPLAVAFIFYIWLKRFKLEINPEYLIYRDGFHRERKVRLCDIKSVENGYSYFKNIGKGISIPRTIITMKDKKIPIIIINTKIFQPLRLGEFERSLKHKLKTIKQ